MNDEKNQGVVIDNDKLKQIEEELHDGIATINKFNPSVTIYGSSRLREDHPYYKKVENLAYRISSELGYAVLSGGGPGIMEAANKGAAEAHGKSIGLTIKLPTEQSTNKYVNVEIPFHYFFTRQSTMSYSTEVCIFCPGGFGTLNELFEILTLEQTNKIGKIPVILYGSEFWSPIEKVIKEILLDKYQTINKEDSEIYKIMDDEDEILKLIKESKIRTGADSLK